MAERYRKGSKERVKIQPKITPEAKAYLEQLAGEYGRGYAIELLVSEHQRRLSAKKGSPILHSPAK